MFARAAGVHWHPSREALHGSAAVHSARWANIIRSSFCKGSHRHGSRPCRTARSSEWVHWLDGGHSPANGWWMEWAVGKCGAGSPFRATVLSRRVRSRQRRHLRKAIGEMAFLESFVQRFCSTCGTGGFAESV